MSLDRLDSKDIKDTEIVEREVAKGGLTRKRPPGFQAYPADLFAQLWIIIGIMSPARRQES